MDRRKFLVGAGMSMLAAAAPVDLLAASKRGGMRSARRVHKTGKLKLSFFPYELKLRHAFNLARYSRTTTPDIQVQLEYDGVVGYGEASMPPYLGESVESVTKFLNSLDLGQFNDPFRIEDILSYVDGVAPGNRAAKASVDIALHDLLGKIMGQPWYKIWGLDPAKAPVTSFTIGIDTEEVVRQKVREASPYKLIKVKMGLDKDQETIDIIKQMMPDVPLCVDCNQGWKDKEHALEMCHWLKERGCVFVEQPFDKEWIDETAWLRERSPLPIIADEAFQRLPDIVRFKGVYDGINIKLMKSTGLHEAYKMITVARALDMKVMIGCMTETSCAVTAAANLSPLVDFADLDGNLLIANDRFKGMTVENGKITLHDIPGIGVELLK
ncbi:MAG: dipeptide epimerase [Muribaculaceae bacterium]|nr:dipeptide epimerase [Muribaculaceae bacterium]MBQ2484564.1 dipeptide epimerase [Muribaculaceae bacterium]